ncbi:MAG: exodeoxyribonuclease VII large subunit [Paludibacteraceae bacterium]|nr:exodeoxyribonuclease VII large subunit [Paludibacteraceae bacterium]
MNALSLSELSALIEQVLSAEMDGSYWVRAEISSVSIKGGHCYLELAEHSGEGLFAAKMRATCWGNLYPMLSAYFQEETGSTLQVGMQILVEVEVNFHAVYGLSLNVINIDPSYTIGDIARKRQQTILKLQKEGVLDMQKSLPLPTVMRRIAVVSSDQAAGYEDFMNQLQQSSYAFSTSLFVATMQGEAAAESIIRALQQIAEQIDNYDGVVIIRGGGATADLSCFDDYMLCAHCAQFPLPILSGIGHTRDISILDMVVHTALKTPTAVAAWLVDRMAIQTERIEQLRVRLRQTAERQIMLRQHKIDLLRQSVAMQSPERIYKKGYSMLTVGNRVIHSAKEVQPGQLLTTHLQDGSIQSVAR